jgi:protein-tyrosine phosphatase
MAENTPQVSGLILHGSHARGEADYFSDIDLLLVVDDFDKEPDSHRQLLADLKSTIGDSAMVLSLSDGKYVHYTQEDFVKVEVQLCAPSNTSQFRRLIEESYVKEDADMVLYDRDKSILTLVHDVRKEVEYIEPGNQFALESQKFLYYYENFFPSFSRGDLYKAYFHYTLALHKLATLLYLANSGSRYVFAPTNLTNKVLSPEMSRLFRGITSTMDPLEMREKLRLMYDMFLDVVETQDIEGKLSKERLRRFNEHIRKRYPIFQNLRDLGYIEGVKRGVLFRSFVLTKYDPKEVLEWMMENSVGTIIDIRSDREIREKPYSDVILKSIEYVQSPIDAKVYDQDILDDKTLSGHRKLYLKTLIRDGDKVRQILETIADERREGILIHCIGGKDRTGIVIAILLMILGISESEIIDDYMLSHSDTKRERIETVFSLIGERGGLKRYLDEIGVDDKLCERLRRKLCSVGPRLE